MVPERHFNTRPLYQQVADEFVSRIVSRQWTPGQPIENETEIARSLGISLGTVRKAFDILSEKKLLERHQGRGTVVADFERGPISNRFTNICNRQGRKVRGEATVHDAALDYPDAETAEAMGLTARSPVVRFERRRTYLGRCFMYEDVFLSIPAAAHPSTQGELDQLALRRWHGQDLATEMVEQVGAEPSNAKDAARLGIDADAAVQTLKRVIVSYNDRPLELRYGRCNLGEDLIYRTQ